MSLQRAWGSDSARARRSTSIGGRLGCWCTILNGCTASNVQGACTRPESLNWGPTDRVWAEVGKNSQKLGATDLRPDRHQPKNWTSAHGAFLNLDLDGRLSEVSSWRSLMVSWRSVGRVERSVPLCSPPLSWSPLRRSCVVSEVRSTGPLLRLPLVGRRATLLFWSWNLDLQVLFDVFWCVRPFMTRAICRGHMYVSFRVRNLGGSQLTPCVFFFC